MLKPHKGSLIKHANSTKHRENLISYSIRNKESLVKENVLVTPMPSNEIKNGTLHIYMISTKLLNLIPQTLAYKRMLFNDACTPYTSGVHA